MTMENIYLSVRNKIRFQQYYINPNVKFSSLSLQKLSVVINFLFAVPEFLIYRSALKGLRSAKNAKNDRAAILIANGPSARTLNLAQVKLEAQSQDLDLLLANFVILDKKYHKRQPNRLVLSDQAIRPDTISARNLQLWDLIHRLIVSQRSHLNLNGVIQ